MPGFFFSETQEKLEREERQRKVERPDNKKVHNQSGRASYCPSGLKVRKCNVAFIQSIHRHKRCERSI